MAMKARTGVQINQPIALPESLTARKQQSDAHNPYNHTLSCVSSTLRLGIQYFLHSDPLVFSLLFSDTAVRRGTCEQVGWRKTPVTTTTANANNFHNHPQLHATQSL